MRKAALGDGGGDGRLGLLHLEVEPEAEAVARGHHVLQQGHAQFAQPVGVGLADRALAGRGAAKVGVMQDGHRSVAGQAEVDLHAVGPQFRRRLQADHGVLGGAAGRTPVADDPAGGDAHVTKGIENGPSFA